MLPKKNYLPYTPQGEREKTGGREGEEEKGGEGKEKRRIKTPTRAQKPYLPA